ncbi:MAG: ABC transporter ATP-binding protein [Armatimonadota bacterium]|nr:ABC transporter ATP-binding protein [Armatimonadota bacterium]
MGSKYILRDVNFHIRQGDTISIMGVSGSGKTTLLKILAGLIRPSSGQVFIDGTDITKLSEDELNRIRHRIGVVFQYGALFDSLTVFENVAFALIRHTRLSRKEIEDIVQEKLALVGLPGTQNLMPAQLSGGMQKRVSLARAIAMNPEILFYDEPTSGLDPIMANVINNLIMEMRNRLGVTSIVVSHDVDSIFRISDRVAMIHDHTIIAYGTADEIRQSEDPRVRQFIEGKPEGPIQPGISD